VVGFRKTKAAVWPNPVGNEASLQLDLSAESLVTISVTDLQGHSLRSLFSSELSKGAQSIQLPYLDLPSGEYLLLLRIGEESSIVPFFKH